MRNQSLPLLAWKNRTRSGFLPDVGNKWRGTILVPMPAALHILTKNFMRESCLKIILLCVCNSGSASQTCRVPCRTRRSSPSCCGACSRAGTAPHMMRHSSLLPRPFASSRHCTIRCSGAHAGLQSKSTMRLSSKVGSMR